MATISLNDYSVSENIQILILEDEPFFQKKMLSTLGDIGFRGKIIVTSNLKEARSELSKTKPDLILSDWNLPDGVGIDFVKSFRSNPAYDNVPCLMVTTMDDIDNILSAMTEGADGYIVKPWEEAEVIEKLAFALEKRRKT